MFTVHTKDFEHNIAVRIDDSDRLFQEIAVHLERKVISVDFVKDVARVTGLLPVVGQMLSGVRAFEHRTDRSQENSFRTEALRGRLDGIDRILEGAVEKNAFAFLL